MNYKLNIIRTEYDDRDFHAEHYLTVSGPLPETLDYRLDLLPVRDQGKEGACAAFSAACMKEWEERKDVGFKDYMSPQYIYNSRSDLATEGMNTRDLMKILFTKGCCPESMYPYGSKTKISQQISTVAANYKIKSYAQVRTSADLKRALYENGPCLIAIPVYNFTTQPWKRNIGESIQGGHAMTIVGYTKKGFIIRNSWGLKWGERGYTYFPFDHWGMQWEVWSTIDAKSTPLPNKKISAVKSLLGKIKNIFK